MATWVTEVLISKEYHSDANSLINGDLPFDPVRYEDGYKTRHADFFVVNKIDESFKDSASIANTSNAGEVSTTSRRKKKKEISKQQLIMLIRSMQVQQASSTDAGERRVLESSIAEMQQLALMKKGTTDMQSIRKIPANMNNMDTQSIGCGSA